VSTPTEQDIAELFEICARGDEALAKVARATHTLQSSAQAFEHGP
jgi:predicted HD phosphohydrolase